MVIQDQYTAIILQMFKSINYFISLVYNDCTLQTWVRSDKWSWYYLCIEHKVSGVVRPDWKNQGLHDFLMSPPFTFHSLEQSANVTHYDQNLLEQSTDRNRLRACLYQHYAALVRERRQCWAHGHGGWISERCILFDHTLQKAMPFWFSMKHAAKAR